MNKIYIPTLICLVLLLVIHYFASQNHLYVRWYGLDIFMHILGGIGLAFSIYWVLSTFFPGNHPSLFSIVVLTFFAGIIWEGLEAYFDIAGAPVGTFRYYVDTIKDLLNDTIGAILAAYFLFEKKFINK